MSTTIHAPTYRLTPRGRAVVFIVSLLVVLAAGVFLGQRSVASEEKGAPEQTKVVMVGSGDTLWGIASDLTEGGDVRDMMQRIEDLNNLETSMLYAGQRLHVPAQ